MQHGYVYRNVAHTVKETMFEWLSPNKKDKKTMHTATFVVSGMHCTSCSMLIDGELEDHPGVVSAHTNYAQGSTEVTFDPEQVQVETLTSIITKLGYTIVAVS